MDVDAIDHVIDVFDRSVGRQFPDPPDGRPQERAAAAGGIQNGAVGSECELPDDPLAEPIGGVILPQGAAGVEID